jgi:hypothetical protein
LSVVLVLGVAEGAEDDALLGGHDLTNLARCADGRNRARLSSAGGALRRATRYFIRPRVAEGHVQLTGERRDCSFWTDAAFDQRVLLSTQRSSEDGRPFPPSDTAKRARCSPPARRAIPRGVARTSQDQPSGVPGSVRP